MSDLISKQEAVKAINKAFARVFEWGGVDPLGEKVLADVPTIEAEPVVRCKDCKHSVMTVRGECKYCKAFDPDCVNKVCLSGEFYCLLGERRGEVEE